MRKGLASCIAANLLPARELELSSAFWADALKLREQSQSLSPAAVELLD